MFKLNLITKIILLGSPFLLASCGGSSGGNGGENSKPPVNDHTKNDIKENYNSSIVFTIHKASHFLQFELSPLSDLSESEQLKGDYSTRLNTVEKIVSTVYAISYTNIDNFRKRIKDIPDLPSFYTTTEQGTFSKKYIKSQTDILIRTPISKTVTTSTVQSNVFHYNTGLIDTSATWSKDKIQNVFRWDRLERDHIAKPPKSLTRGLIQDSTELDFLMNDSAKIIVIDNSLKKSLNLDYGRLDYEYYIYKNNEKAKNKVAHGDGILYALMGKPYDTGLKENLFQYSDSEWHKQGIQYFVPGFLINKGRIAFFGSNEYSDKADILGYNVAQDPRMLELVRKGYKIVNMSFEAPIEMSKLDELKKQYNTPLYEGILKLPNHLSYLKRFEPFVKEDVLFIQGAGNGRDRTINQLSYYPLINKAVQDGFINVIAYDFTKDKKADYSNSCGETRFYCLAAHDRLVYQFNEKYNYAFDTIYQRGTSLAAPYVSSTAGLVKSVFPFFTNHNLKTTILTTAKDVGDKGVDTVYGWGLVQPHIAVNGPMQFFDKNFTVNLGHDEYLFQKNSLFRFSNDISGSYGLIVNNTGSKNTALSLSGHNTYKGNTVVNKGAILNIDGINENKIVNHGILYGSGKLDHLYNNGNVYNYSLFKSLSPNDKRSQYGMLIDGNYEQTHNGVLSVYLGQPLLVKGFAILDGVLNVEGIKQGYIRKDGRVFEDVLVSQKGIAGKFQLLKLPQNLQNGKLTYNRMNLGSSALYTVSLFAEYMGLDHSLYGFESAGVNVSEETRQTLAKLDDRIHNYLEKTNEKESVDLDEHSSLTQIMSNVQWGNPNAVSQLSIIENKPLSKSLNESRTMEAMSHFNFIANQIDKKGASYRTQADQHYFNIKHQSDIDLGVQFQKGKFDSNRITQEGVKLAIGSNWFHFTGGYQRQKYDLNNMESKLQADFYQLGAFANYSIKGITPYVGYDYNILKLKGQQEKYNGFNAKLNKQSIYNHNIFAGVNYVLPLYGVNFKMDYFIKHTVSDDKPLKGVLSDSIIETDWIIGQHQKKTVQIAKIGVEKQFKDWYLELDASYLPQKHKTYYGMKLSYVF